MRTCRVCKLTKALEDFEWAGRKGSTARRHRCRACRSAQNVARVQRTPGLRASYGKRWRETHPEADPRAAWEAAHPEAKQRVLTAHAAVQHALRKGLLIRPDICESCGARSKIEAAHFNYDELLRVRWLCRSCHRRWDHADAKSKPAHR